MATEQVGPLSPVTGATAEREIVAFSVMVDSTRQFLHLKLVLADGANESLILALPVVHHIRETLLSSLRSRRGRTTLPTDAAFFDRLPARGAADWDLSRDEVAVPSGCEIVTHPDICRLGFPLRDREGRRQYRLRPLYAGYLLHAINHALEQEGLGETVPEAVTLH